MQMDMTEIMARVQEMNAQRAEATAAKRIEVKKTLEAHGITAVSAEYDAYGDSGNIESVRWEPKTKQLSPEVERCAADLLWDVVYDLHPGFENNDGGDGEVEWDVSADKMQIEHRERFTDYNSYSHEGV